MRELISDFDSPTNPSFNRSGSTNPVALEGIHAGGDSGGGLFIEFGGQQQLAGIVQGVSWYNPDGNLPPSGGYGSEAITTKVSPFAAWIRDHLDVGSFQATNGMTIPFDTPSLWQTSSSTNGVVNVVPQPFHSVIFNAPALNLTNNYSIRYAREISDTGGFYWDLQLTYPARSKYTVTFSQNRSSTRLRVRRGTDVTFNLGGYTYSITSTSPHSPSVAVGQTRDDHPILTITNGTLNAFDAAVGESLTGYFQGWNGGGAINVAGPGTEWVLRDSLFIGGRRSGRGASGIVTITSGAQLSVAKTLKLWFTKRYGDLGTGAYELTGTLNLNGGAAAVGTLDIFGGVISGNGTIRSTNSVNWFGGKLIGSGSLDALGGLTITGGVVSNLFNLDWNEYSAVNPPPVDHVYDPHCGVPRPFTFDGWSITNHGLAVFSGGLTLTASNNAKFVNLSTGSFETQSDAALTGSASFSNFGTFRKSAGTNTSNVQWVFSNPGTLQVESGTLQLSGAVPQFSNSVLSAGTWRVINNSRLAVLLGASITTNRAIVELEGSGSTFTNLNPMLANEGAFAIRNGRNFSTTGNFINSGSLTVGVGSTFTTTGGLSQLPGGVLVMELSPTPGESAKVVCATPATIAGQLQIALPSIPAQTQNIELVSFPSATGTFDSVQFPTIPGVSFDIAYSPTNVILTVTPPVPLAITSASLAGTNVLLSWTGGIGIYDVERATNLTTAQWETIVGPVSDTNAFVPVVAPNSFFRVRNH